MLQYGKTYHKHSNLRFDVEAMRRQAGGAWELENEGLCDKIVDSPHAYPQREVGDPLAAAQKGIGLTATPLAEVLTHIDTIRHRPLLIRTHGTPLGDALEDMQTEAAPCRLVTSPHGEDEVTLIDGQNADGESLKATKLSLSTVLAPCFGTLSPPVDAFAQVEWFLDAEPQALPRALLGHSETSSLDEPSGKTSVLLSVGQGPGKLCYQHGATLFVQLWGEKKWSIFGESDMQHFLDPTAPRTPDETPALLPKMTATLASPVWDEKVQDGLPRPMEVITQPGDILYLPHGTWHATWNLSDYTAGYAHQKDR